MLSALAWLTTSAVFSGCLGGSANTLLSGQPGAPGIQKFLVCPPNMLIALPAEVQEGIGPVRQQIEAYLRFQGRDVQTLNLFEAQQAFAKSLASAKEAGAIERTIPLFAAALAQSHPFDALVMPSILLHKTRVTENNGQWDGVSRDMRMVNLPKLPTADQDWLAESLRVSGISGDVPVTSVHVVVYSPGGERVFEGRGGLEFLYEVDLANARKYQWKFRARNDLFQDVDRLREAIEVAFDPFLTPPKE